jgi:UDP-glucose 4-epimerase
MVETFKKVNGVDIPYIITQRRPGDIATSYADASKAYEMLNWKATHTLEDMVRDAWHYEQMKKDQ